MNRSKNIGVIGLDAMHAVALTTAINQEQKGDYLGYRVTHAYPEGSKTLEYRKKSIPKNMEAVSKLGVQLVDSIEDLLNEVDQVILTSNDGHVHLQQALPVIKARKALFIDKPLAGTFEDAVAIYKASQKYNTPVFSSSSLRFISKIQELRNTESTKVHGAHSYCSASFEQSLPELLWYAIHGIEMLFAVMGTGCVQVQRTATEDYDHLSALWADGRIGTYRGIRKGKTGFGGTAFTDQGAIDLGGFEGYEPLALAIVNFFKSKIPPVTLKETLEIFAFIFAAEESKIQGGAPVKINMSEISI